MADSNSVKVGSAGQPSPRNPFALLASSQALARTSKRGISMTSGSGAVADGFGMAPPMSIGAVDDDEFLESTSKGGEKSSGRLAESAASKAAPGDDYRLPSDFNSEVGHFLSETSRQEFTDDEQGDFQDFSSALESLKSQSDASTDASDPAMDQIFDLPPTPPVLVSEAHFDHLVDDEVDPVIIPGLVKKNPFIALTKEGREEISQMEHLQARSYKEPVSSSPFAHLSKEESSRAVNRSARNDIHAVKVVTKLVQGIAHNPGSGASTSVKSTLLRDQLVLVGYLSRELAESCAPNEGHKPWVLAQFSDAVAEMISKATERSRGIEFEKAADVARQCTSVACEVMEMSRKDAQLAAVFDTLQNSRYVAAQDSATAKQRIMVSMSSAMWDLHEKISEVGFIYGSSMASVIQDLSRDVLKTAMDASIEIDNLDMKTSHIQGSVRRYAGLLGAEYCARARNIQEWIKDGALEGDATRERKASEMFSKEILPQVLASARKNFLSVERVAVKMMEDVYEADFEKLKPSRMRERQSSN
jgi:hypothetical protein